LTLRSSTSDKNKHRSRVHRGKAGSTAAILLCGCAVLLCCCSVGPNFLRPAAPTDAGFAPKPLPEVSVSAPVYGGEAQHFLSGHDIPFDWWTSFQCPQLNTLVGKALRANATIESAKAALRQAREVTRAAEGAFFPTVQGNFTPSRNKTATGAVSPASASGNPYYGLYTATVSVSYVPDVFGGTRRHVESLRAQEDMQRFETEAAYITLASNVVAAAILEVSTRSQIAATEEIIDVERQSLEILRNQQRFGYAMGIDAAAQEAALAQVEQTLPPLQKQLETTRDLIRALAGNLPSQDVEETFQLSSLHLPEDLPLSLPSEIIKQRPDVRAAEEQMRSANADVGVALAAMLPQFALTANLGAASNSLNNLFGPGTSFWSLAGSATQTIFDGGTLLHTKRAADEALVQAAAEYRGTVITAFQNVADTLHALLSDADALKAAAVAEKAAKVTLDLTQRQSQAGYVNYLTLLSAQQAYQTALLNLVQAQAARFSDTAALFQALGGGWWNRPVADKADEAGGDVTSLSLAAVDDRPLHRP
jgi:NodT family efflux transporter outer membrane factor (OMF) lipoprotein